MTIVDWLLAVADTVDEVIQLRLQCFGRFHLWRPHVPRPIINQHLIDTLAALNINPFVINLDLFIRFQIVPHQHFLFAADKSRPDLHWTEPVHVDVSNYLSWKIYRQKSNVCMSVHVSLTFR